MIWTKKQLQGGQLVASQTTSGGFKDVHILSRVDDGKWQKVSLLDGLAHCLEEEAMLVHLNTYRFVPIAKVVASQYGLTLPENRIGLPVVVLMEVGGSQ